MQSPSLLKWSWKEIWQGQLQYSLFAISLICASVFALTALFFRIDYQIEQNRTQALTADAVYQSANPIPPKLLSLTADLATAHQIRFSTMIFHQDQMQLVSVNAIDSRYPLKGQLVLAGDRQIRTHIQPGELWLSKRIQQQLDLPIGAQVTVGNLTMTVNGTVTDQPGLLINPFSFASTIWVHAEDIGKIGALSPGSRVRYQYFINAPSAQISKLKKEIKLTASDKWLNLNEDNQQNRQFRDAKYYLSLIVVIIIAMSSLILVLTCQHYVSSRQQSIAMLKSLGASRNWLIRWLGVQVILIFVMGTLFGFVIGYCLDLALQSMLASLLAADPSSYSIKPFLAAQVTCLCVGLPALLIPLSRLLDISPRQISQAIATGINRKWHLTLLVPLISVALYYRENMFIWILLLALLGLFALCAILSLVLVKAIQRCKLSAPMQCALNRISRSPKLSSLQFGTLSMSLMLVLIIYFIRQDILNDWQQALPDDAPNIFAINISQQDKQSYLTQLDAFKLNHSQIFPIVRGRLTQIKDTKVVNGTYQGEADSALRRELNLTWSDSAPYRNEIVKGKLQGTQAVSIEQRLANRLGIEVGDSLSFVINSETFKVTVNSIRHVEWRDLRPNFFFIFTPDVLQELSPSWILSFRIENSQDDILNKLARQFPTVSLIDIRTIGQKLKQILTKMIQALTLMTTLGLVASFLLILTLLNLSINQRKDEIRLYRTLGASHIWLRKTLYYEYGSIALIATVIAIIGAEVANAAIIHFIFKIDVHWHPAVWLSAPIFMSLGLVLLLQYTLFKLLRA